MSKLEKIVVSTDPESAALIEEIQNSLYDRLLDAVAESLPKSKFNASVSAVDITPILDNQKKILENQKSILNSLNGNVSGDKVPRGTFPQKIELWSKSGHCIRSINDSGAGLYCAFMDNINTKKIYIADSNGKPYGVNGDQLLPGKQDWPISASDIKDCYIIFNLNTNKFEIIE